jgi:copper(I)-binding protein
MPDGFVSGAFSLRKTALLAALGAVCVAHGASAGSEQAERVRGYFCDAKADQIAFLNFKARGETEVMAANTVNKGIAKMSCAPYLPVMAIPGKEQTVMKDGLVYKLQSFTFLPEKVERWSGTVLGSLQVTEKDQDI